MARPRHSRLPCFAALMVTAGACQSSSDGPRTWPTAVEDCLPQGMGRPGKCVTVQAEVMHPETGIDTWPVQVVILPALEDVRGVPIFLLAGGPGQAASEVFGPLVRTYADVGRTHDIVLVDQRGAGSHGTLRCPAPENLAALLAPTPDLDRIRACATAVAAAIPPQAFSTLQATREIEAARELLGVPRLALVGGSYGTSLALAYAREFPERVDRLVLDGVAPPDMQLPLTFPQDTDDALAALTLECAAQKGCPLGENVNAIAHEVVNTFTATTIELSHPRTGVREVVTVNRTTLAASIRGLLYAQETAALVPWLVQTAQAGDAWPLMQLSASFADVMSETFSDGLFFSLICSEDALGIDRNALNPAFDHTLLGKTFVQNLLATCDAWPHRQASARERAAVHFAGPALLLSGTLDPATPPKWAEHAAQTLPGARLLTLPQAAHGTLLQGCMPDIVQAFLDGQDTTALDVDCLEHATTLRFFVNGAGPLP